MFEIERKFLIADNGWRASSSLKIEMIRQGYVPSPNVCIRIRTFNDDRGEVTFKSKPLDELEMVRIEYNFPIPFPSAHDILNKLCEFELIKRRHTIKKYGKIWEIDEFYGDLTGLILAEVELSQPTERFALPSWIGEEVTQDERFSNFSLAQYKTELIKELFGE